MAEQVDSSVEADARPGRQLTVSDFFNKFLVEVEEPYTKKCRYCTYTVGTDLRRFRMHLAGIKKQGARVCQNAPLHVIEAAKHVVTTFKNGSKEDISAAVRLALLWVSIELDEEENFDHSDSGNHVSPRDEVDIDEADSVRNTEETRFRGYFSLPSEEALLLENALRKYGALWPEDRPEFLTLAKYKMLLKYLRFIKNYKGLPLGYVIKNKETNPEDNTIEELVDGYVQCLTAEGFNVEKLHVLSHNFKDSGTDALYDETLGGLRDQCSLLEDRISEKKKELRVLEDKAARAMKKMRSYESQNFRF